MLGINLSRKIMMLGSFATALIVTGGVFAATFTVRSQTVSISPAGSDYASVTTNATPASASLLGSHTGTLGEATMFDIAGSANYTGDLSVIVSLVNADEMIQDYRFWLMRLQLTNSANQSVDVEGITKLISLANPTAEFTIDSANITGSVTYIRTPGTIFRTLPFALGSTGADPQIFVEVLQAGAQ